MLCGRAEPDLSIDNGRVSGSRSSADALALELWLDEREAALEPERRAHERAALARALADRDPPPPPSMLLDPAWLALPPRAARTGDRGLQRRALTLARWSLQARVACDPIVREAAASPRDLIGLAARQRALARVAPGLGVRDAATLTSALYGAAPLAPAPEPDPEPEVDAGPVPVDAIPTVRRLVAMLAVRTATDPSPITIHQAPRAMTIVVVPGEEIHCLVRSGDDDVATVIVAAHELGHGLLAAARRGVPATMAAPIHRVADETVAALAVRALEDPAVIPDAGLRAVFARRRRRRERLTAALARFEAACLAGAAPVDAWSVVAAVDRRPAAAFPALFDEPGVMAAYHAADVAAARGGA